MMKKVYIGVTGFCVLILLFSGCYYLSYRMALRDFNQRASEQGNELLFADDGQNAVINDPAVIAADTSRIDLVKPATLCIMQTYDVTTGELSEETVDAPDYLLGFSREDVINYLNSYMSDVPLEEYQNGLMSYELVSFSDQKVILKKTYNKDSVPYRYCMAVRDGMVVVYYSDRKTVFEYTGILSADLPEKEQKKLNYGIFIKDDKELYGILENYSS